MSSHPWLVDATIAGIYLFFYFGLFLLIGLTAGYVVDPDTGETLSEPISRRDFFGLSVYALLGGLVILLRRRFVWPGFVVALLITVATHFVDSSGAASGGDIIPLTIMLYSLGVYESAKAAWLGLGVSSISLTLAFTDGIRDIFGYSFVVIGTVLFLATVTLIGVNVGNRRRYLWAVEQLAAQLIDQQETQAQLVAAQERAAVAREMHDVVSHTLSVMVALADGAKAAYSKKPQVTAQALEQLADTGRDAMSDMRRILTVLRSDETATKQPQPSAQSLPELIDSYRAAGLPIEVDDERCEAVVADLDDALSLVVYRVIQESLTNVLKHASKSSRVIVAVECKHEGGTHIQLLVRNEIAEPVSRISEDSSSGHGLVGMSERVQAYGGEVSSGPWSYGLRHGWQVLVRLPKDGMGRIS